MKNFIALCIAAPVFAAAPISAWSIDKKVYSGTVLKQGTATFAPGGAVLAPGGGTHGVVGGTVATELTVNECTKLGCSVQDDRFCVAFIVGSPGIVSTVKKRCVCAGGSSCITEASQ